MSKILVGNQLKYVCQVTLEDAREEAIKFVGRLLQVQVSLDLTPFSI